MSNLSPPPTYAPLTVPSLTGGENAVNPVWLQWFLSYAGQSNGVSNAVLQGAYSNLTSSRNLNNLYTAPSTGPVLVNISIKNGSIVISDADLVIYPPGTSHVVYPISYAVNIPAGAYYNLSGKVPGGWGYQVLGFAADSTLEFWLEW